MAGHGEADRALHRRSAALAPTVFAWYERLAASPEGQALWTCRPRGQGCAASKAAGREEGASRGESVSDLTIRPADAVL